MIQTPGIGRIMQGVQSRASLPSIFQREKGGKPNLSLTDCSIANFSIKKTMVLQVCAGARFHPPRSCSQTSRDRASPTLVSQSSQSSQTQQQSNGVMLMGPIGQEPLAATVVALTTKVILAQWPETMTGLSPVSVLVEQVIKHTKSTFSTCMLSLIYLHRFRMGLAALAAPPSPIEPDCFPSPTQTTSHGKSISSPFLLGQLHHNNQPQEQQQYRPSILVPGHITQKGLCYTVCGRRMFIASILLAHKYHQEPAVKNRVWARLTGLALAEINEIEKQALALLGYRVHVTATEYYWFLQSLSGTCEKQAMQRHNGANGDQQVQGFGMYDDMNCNRMVHRP